MSERTATPRRDRASLRDRVWTPSRAGGPPTMRRPAVYVLAAATVLVLGANWPIMSTGVDLVAPLWLATFRMTGAALVIAAVLAAQGRMSRPVRADRPIWLSIGLARLAAVTALVFVALRFVPPGRSSILAYTGALWTAPLAAIFLHEPLTRLRLGGLVVGTLGLAVLLEPWALDWGDTELLVGTGMLVLAATLNASTTVHIRGHRWVGSPIELMPWQLGLAAVPIAALALALEGAPDVRWTLGTAAIVAYQVFLGSAFGLWGLLTIGRSLPAITANLSVMAVPVVGLGTSVAFVDEPLTAAVVVGLVLVLTGVGLGLLSDRLAAEGLLPAA
jgi:drug/metabolite transporter (DMT)-like permease